MKFVCCSSTAYLSSLYLSFFVPSFLAFPGATITPRTKISSCNNVYFQQQYQKRNPLYQSISSFPSIVESSSTTSSAVLKLTYRSAENKDLATVSNLVCANLYRNSRKGWFIDKFIRIYRELDTQQALNHRMMSYMSSNRKLTGDSYRQHSMFVAVGVNSLMPNQEDQQQISSLKKSDIEKLIGFIEIGQVKMQSLIPDNRENDILVPHIGNLVVADGFRRQGVGLGLMTVACQTAKSWGYPAVYCGVHSNNSAAIDLYTRKLDFQIVHSKVSDGGDIDYVLEKLLS